ncbi:MAG: 2Fe-2S iron-sulfur cluster binding domain-containing protein, partial [Rubrivivax sp.]
MSLALTVNGAMHEVAADRHASLLTVLRNDLGLNGPKYGCGLGECGACTVLVDGVAARACVIPAGGVQGREITTLEGLGTRAAPHRVQQAFIDEQAALRG